MKHSRVQAVLVVLQGLGVLSAVILQRFCTEDYEMEKLHRIWLHWNQGLASWQIPGIPTNNTKSMTLKEPRKFTNCTFLSTHEHLMEHPLSTVFQTWLESTSSSFKPHSKMIYLQKVTYTSCEQYWWHNYKYISPCRLIYPGFEITQFFVHLILRII